jgi:hypothetical protein
MNILMKINFIAAHQGQPLEGRAPHGQLKPTWSTDNTVRSVFKIASHSRQIYHVYTIKALQPDKCIATIFYLRILNFSFMRVCQRL